MPPFCVATLLMALVYQLRTLHKGNKADSIRLVLVFRISGPVVQSIVSLTSSLRGQFVKCFTTFITKYTDIFC